MLIKCLLAVFRPVRHAFASVCRELVLVWDCSRRKYESNTVEAYTVVYTLLFPICRH